MPHILNITNGIIREYLYSMTTGAIRPKVTFSGIAQPQIGTDPGGFPIFGAAQSVVWDVSCMVMPGGVKFSQSKPVLFGRSGDDVDPAADFLSGKVTIEFSNPSHEGYIAAAGDDGIMPVQTIEQGEFIIEAAFTGSAITQNMPLFTGKIEGPPKETFGNTVFTLYDVTFSKIINPALFENFSQEYGGAQYSTFVFVGGLSNNYVDVDTNVDKFRAYGGTVTFDESGRLIDTVTNNEPARQDIRQIVVLNGAKPGDYSIEFTTATNYKVTYPDNKERYGSILSDFAGGFIFINKSYWSSQDGEGVKIEFKVPVFTWDGNPGTMIRKCIECAYLDNIGIKPGVDPAAVTLPVDWLALEAFERNMKGYRLQVSQMQEDNASWKQDAGNRPFTYLRAAQKIAEHAGATLLVGLNGQLTIQPLQIWETPESWDTECMIMDGFSIAGPPGGTKWNMIEVRYALNHMTGTYGKVYTQDYRLDPANDKPQKMHVTLPYWRAGTGDNKVKWLVQVLKEKFIDRPHSFNIKLLPNHHLAAMPGDRVTLGLNTHPRKTISAEVYTVTAKSPGLPGAVQLVATQEPEGAPWVLCESLLGEAVT